MIPESGLCLSEEILQGLRSEFQDHCDRDLQTPIRGGTGQTILGEHYQGLFMDQTMGLIQPYAQQVFADSDYSLSHIQMVDWQIGISKDGFDVCPNVPPHIDLLRSAFQEEEEYPSFELMLVLFLDDHLDKEVSNLIVWKGGQEKVAQFCEAQSGDESLLANVLGPDNANFNY